MEKTAATARTVATARMRKDGQRDEDDGITYGSLTGDNVTFKCWPSDIIGLWFIRDYPQPNARTIAHITPDRVAGGNKLTLTEPRDPLKADKPETHDAIGRMRSGQDLRARSPDQGAAWASAAMSRPIAGRSNGRPTARAACGPGSGKRQRRSLKWRAKQMIWIDFSSGMRWRRRQKGNFCGATRTSRRLLYLLRKQNNHACSILRPGTTKTTPITSRCIGKRNHCSPFWRSALRRSSETYHHWRVFADGSAGSLHNVRASEDC